MGRLLSIDYGRKRCGIAVTDTLCIVANGLTTIPTHMLIDFVKKYIESESVDKIIVGHPTTMRGEDSESMQYIQPFINRFKKIFPNMPLKEYDERFTSVIAHQAMIAGGMKKKQRQDKTVVDKLAACIILEGYLDSIR